MLIGYNTNGLAHHDPFEAVELLGDIGYQSVAITLDHGTLNPYDDRCAAQVDRMRALLSGCGMQSVVETGARYLLDPRVKHEPTLMTADTAARERRIDFLCRAIDIASSLGSRCVSLWSGIVRDDVSDDEAWRRLTDGLERVLEHAARRQVVLGFEPEPGMFVDTMERFERLRKRNNSTWLRLTLDVGHLHCMGEVPIAERIDRWGREIVNVHIEDMRSGVHEHLMFGEGDIDFPPVLDALARAGYQGGVHVELSRHSHEGPSAARRAYDFLAPLMASRSRLPGGT
jgi:sugar phosphate isomerase/epimerase